GEISVDIERLPALRRVVWVNRGGTLSRICRSCNAVFGPAVLAGFIAAAEHGGGSGGSKVADCDPPSAPLPPPAFVPDYTSNDSPHWGMCGSSSQYSRSTLARDSAASGSPCTRNACPKLSLRVDCSNHHLKSVTSA